MASAPRGLPPPNNKRHAHFDSCHWNAIGMPLECHPVPSTCVPAPSGRILCQFPCQHANPPILLPVPACFRSSFRIDTRVATWVYTHVLQTSALNQCCQANVPVIVNVRSSRSKTNAHASFHIFTRSLTKKRFPRASQQLRSPVVRRQLDRHATVLRDLVIGCVDRTTQRQPEVKVRPQTRQDLTGISATRLWLRQITSCHTARGQVITYRVEQRFTRALSPSLRRSLGLTYNASLGS